MRQYQDHSSGGWTFSVFFIYLLSFLTIFEAASFQANAAPDVPTPQHVYSNTHAKRIAVIGAGSAGSSTSYYLQKFAAHWGINVNITVFERSSYVGGRSTTVNAYNNPLERVELGASIFVEINSILKNATEAFGLKPKDSETEGDDTLGIWNGERFVFKATSKGWYYWDVAKMLWKYGWAPIRTQKLTKATVGKFLKLYEAPFFPFRSLTERAIDLDLINTTSVTGRQYLEFNNIGEPFATDIIQASTRVNYAQNLGRIHGLETMVCMAIEGAMQIEGGNWQIFDGMLNASNANVLLNTAVSSISKQDGKYSIKTSPTNANGERHVNEELFDTVVLAAPLQYTNITIEKGLFRYTPDVIPYVTLHVTLFASSLKLNPLYFNLALNEEAPSTVLTTLPPNANLNDTEKAGPAGFFSISTLRTAINPSTGQNEFLYKIFSPEVVTPTFLSGILGVPVPEDLTTIASDSGGPITWYYPHVWNSYPVELPRVTFEELQLARGFYYTSGIESFISTMETSALMGMNVAQLIVNDYLELLVKDEDITGQANVFENWEVLNDEL